jgi:hypothetical protein
MACVALMACGQGSDEKPNNQISTQQEAASVTLQCEGTNKQRGESKDQRAYRIDRDNSIVYFWDIDNLEWTPGLGSLSISTSDMQYSDNITSGKTTLLRLIVIDRINGGISDGIEDYYEGNLMSQATFVGTCRPVGKPSSRRF